MDPRLKQAAARILEISSKLEKRASEQTFFVCDSCNHTASLASINRMRKEAADSQGIKDVGEVTVNDSLECKACGGDMSYVPTEESRRFYVEAADEEDLPPVGEEEPEEGKPEEEESEEEGPKGKTPFKPVDEQETEDMDLGLPEEGAPGKGVPEKKPGEEETMEEEGVIEEEVPEETPEGEESEKPSVEKKPKKKKTTKDKPDDKKVKFPKDETPKFEKMPKDASEGFHAAVAKYWPV